MKSSHAVYQSQGDPAGDLHHLQLSASPLHLSSRSGGHGAVPGLSGLRLRAGVAGLRRGPQPLPLPPPAPRQRRHGPAAGLLRVEDIEIESIWIKQS